MYRLADLPPSPADIAELARLQRSVNRGATFEARVANAKQKFSAKPTALFKRLRSNLEIMSGDLVRCSYCEDSRADEVEHMRPKDFYPEHVFRWANYLFACGICNRGKNNKYAVRNVGGQIVDLRTHRRTNGIVAPPTGDHLFIDPRTEDPMGYLWLDIAGGTFRFAVLDETDPWSVARAERTRDDLRLNRDDLVAARENAYTGYVDRLAQYIARRRAGDAAHQLNNRIRELRRSPHHTVWLEMKRQQTGIAALADLFADEPDALNW